MADTVKSLLGSMVPKMSGEAPPQEASEAPADGEIPGLLVPGNINLDNRIPLKNKDGTISTVRSISIEVDGKEVLIPTVSESGKSMSKKEAIETYRKTGQHLGIFDSVKNANSYAEILHQKQADQYPDQDTSLLGTMGKMK